MIKEDFKKCKDVMCDIMGVDDSDFSHSRRYPLPYARAIVANYLHDLDYTYTEIARELGKNHSTLVYICHKLDDIKDSKNFRLVGEIYKRFNEIVDVRD